jgi:glycosyltransferase involved in cell wall biosynthesis
MDTCPARSTPGLPTVSIIVPCYKYARFLNETLAQVQRQNFNDWECLIVDVRFLDADDLLLPFQLENQLAQQEYSQTDIICGQFVFITHDGTSFYQWSHIRSRIRDDDTFGDLLASWEKGLMIPIHALLYRRECFERWGYWDEHLITHDDWEILLRFAAHGTRFLHRNEIVAAYRKHDGSLAGDATKMRQGFLKVMLKLLESPCVARRYKPLILFRFLEDCFKAVVQKIQKRGVCLKAIYFDAKNQSPYRAWLLLAFALAFPLLAVLKLGDMIRVRQRIKQGDYQRVHHDGFDFAPSIASSQIYS